MHVYTHDLYIFLQEAKIGEKVCFKAMKSSEGLSVKWSGEDECDEFHTPKPHILQIDSVTDSHFGVYKCEVRKEGELKFTMYKHLFKKGKLMPIHTTLSCNCFYREPFANFLHVVYNYSHMHSLQNLTIKP